MHNLISIGTFSETLIKISYITVNTWDVKWKLPGSALGVTGSRSVVSAGFHLSRNFINTERSGQAKRSLVLKATGFMKITSRVNKLSADERKKSLGEIHDKNNISSCFI